MLTVRRIKLSFQNNNRRLCFILLHPKSLILPTSSSPCSINFIITIHTISCVYLVAGHGMTELDVLLESMKRYARALQSVNGHGILKCFI